jgi:hypothetical protein
VAFFNIEEEGTLRWWRGMATENSEGEESLNPDSCIVWNVNLLCGVGACIGVAALFLTWIYEPLHVTIRNEPTIVYMVATQYLYYGAAVVFLIGTVVAFVSPLGGVLQVAGLIVFALGIVDSGNDQWLKGYDPQQELRIGMYLGIVSCSLVLASLFRPLGTGKLRPARVRHIRLVERLLTVSQSLR